MDSPLRNALRLAMAACRRWLEEDLGRQLEATYGVHLDGQIEPLDRLAHLDAAGRAERRSIEDALKHYQAQGAKPAEAIARFVRESAFTALNRLAALKLMEQPERQLIQPSIGEGAHSKGFTQFALVSPELIRAQPDGGYRMYLELLYDDLSRLLGVLFDRSLPQSLLFPGTATLQQALDQLNQDALAETWRQDETIGWIYQFFTPKELRDQARKESAAPRNSYELAFRNQFYTPRYVVEFLVDNTLGRLWWEMRQGDTALTERCRYLVRMPGQPIPPRPKRDPRTLRALDPASGSGHFLLYGYDLFEVIYEEAYADADLGPALQQEFPTLAEYRRAIPALILEHNLHGIEIDRRAAQIGALALWLRAQRAYQQAGLKVAQRPIIRRVNLVVAEPMPAEDDLLDEFIASLANPATGDLVRAMWQAMHQADEIGSLLKIEQTFEQEAKQVERAWQNLSQYEQAQLFEPAVPPAKQLDLDLAFVTDYEFWQERFKPGALEALRRLAAHAEQDHPVRRRLFANDAEGGFAFLELLLEPFDIVWMNPPFGAASKGSKAYIDANYPRTKNDLYAAFVERGLELLRERGLLGAITSRTGFFLTSFRAWREELLIPRTHIHVVADLGYGVLDTAMVETAAYVLEKREVGGAAAKGEPYQWKREDAYE
ncbi:MAG: SAM-dependent methyltransferase [Chloroflexi bacterium]|nr:SAM-dependent methyltransferase [Chloroflexota bacterium]